MNNDNSYLCNYTVMYKDIDTNYNLRIRNLIEYIQESSIAHSDLLGYTVERLVEDNTSFILSNMHVKISRLPKYKEKFSIDTWVPKLKGFSSERAYVIRDESNTPIIWVSSKWVFYDTANRKPLKMTPNVIDLFKSSRGSQFETKYRDIDIDFEKISFTKSFVLRDEIDSNDHVNNTNYLKWAYNALPNSHYQKTPRNIIISFKNECVFGDETTHDLYQNGDIFKFEVSTDNDLATRIYIDYSDDSVET